MATGDTLVAFTPLASVPPGVNPATPDVTGANVPVLDFDDSTNESIRFIGVMPGQYDGSTALNVVLGWKFSTYVGSQTCDWEVSFARIADDADSIESLVFATAQTTLATEAGTSGELDYATIGFSNAQADGIQPNEMFVLRVLRDASGGTASPGDAELAFVEIKLQ